MYLADVRFGSVAVVQTISLERLLSAVTSISQWEITTPSPHSHVYEPEQSRLILQRFPFFPESLKNFLEFLGNKSVIRKEQ